MGFLDRAENIRGPQSRGLFNRCTAILATSAEPATEPNQFLPISQSEVDIIISGRSKRQSNSDLASLQVGEAVRVPKTWQEVGRDPPTASKSPSIDSSEIEKLLGKPAKTDSIGEDEFGKRFDAFTRECDGMGQSYQAPAAYFDLLINRFPEFCGILYLNDSSAKRLVPWASRGFEEMPADGFAVPGDQSPIATSLIEGEIVITTEVSAITRLWNPRDESSFKRAALIPLRSSEDIVGLLLLAEESPQSVETDLRAWCERIAKQCSSQMFTLRTAVATVLRKGRPTPIESIDDDLPGSGDEERSAIRIKIDPIVNDVRQRIPSVFSGGIRQDIHDLISTWFAEDGALYLLPDDSLVVTMRHERDPELHVHQMTLTLMELLDVPRDDYEPSMRSLPAGAERIDENGRTFI